MKIPILAAALLLWCVAAVTEPVGIVPGNHGEPDVYSNKSNTTGFHYRSYSDMVDAMERLQKTYPQYVKLDTVHDLYNLPLRSELQCTLHNNKVPCQHYVLTITDLLGASLMTNRPHVFFSGALHGNERVGPQAAIALAELLAEHVTRVDGNLWLQRLVKTRRIVIMPMPNPFGYDNANRTENSIDPNRDFPYSKSGDACFQTMTARAVNEVWRNHLFQLALTWHAGTQSISYAWGGFNHALSKDGKGSFKSPDDNAQFLLARGFSRFGGQFADNRTYYPDGPINDVVYAVDGGMEDWGYAASWENSVTTPPPIGVCSPKTYDGYAPEKSTYNNVTHRAFTILIETSKNKTPSEADLGATNELFDAAIADYLPKDTAVGHVARNVRIALMMIDLVEPYIQWISAPVTAKAGPFPVFTWRVGGAVTVDQTYIRYSVDENMKNATELAKQSGFTRWYHADMGSIAVGQPMNRDQFTASVPLSQPGTYYVEAVVVVDQNWATQGTGNNTAVPNVRPQSHVVNARTNPNWYASNNGYVIQGQQQWLSSTVKINIEY